MASRVALKRSLTYCRVGMLLAIVEAVFFLATSAVCLFWSAGTVDWPSAWWFLMLNVIVMFVGFIVVDPELVRERAGAEHDLKSWDLPLSSAMFVFLLLIP
ncbi:MAG TPA: hypothetical protein VMT89_00045, partial [Candidatus Acidoferrales bacterium]|nr:hypothetical protein [Candidatus Acidoferrales bacterium]